MGGGIGQAGKGAPGDVRRRSVHALRLVLGGSVALFGGWASGHGALTRYEHPGWYAASGLLLLILLLIVVRHLAHRRHVTEVRKDNAALRAAFLQSALDAIIIFDSEGCIVEFNAAAEASFGYKRDDVLGRELAWQLLPDLNVSLRESRPVVAEPYRCQMGAVRADGTRFTAEVALVPLTFRGRLHYASHVRDVSEIERNRLALQASERNYRELISHMTEVVFRTDAEGRWLFLSRAWTDITGWSVEESLGESFMNYVHPGDREQNVARFKPLLACEKDRCWHEVRYIRKDGSVCWMEVIACAVVEEGVVVGTTGTLTDITRRHAAEVVLRLQERAISSSSNGIVIVDARGPDQPVIYVNPAFERITGYERDEVLGRNCRFLQGGDREQSGLESLRAALREQRECDVILRNYRKDGTPFWNQLSISPVRDETGMLTHFVGVQSDITERRRMETQLEEKRLRLDSILMLSPDGFVAFGPEGRIVETNPAFLRMTGFTLDTLVGLDETGLEARLRELSDPKEPYPLLAELDDSTVAGQLAKREERRTARRQTLVLRTPARRILERSMRQESGGTRARVVYFRDVTREREVERMKSEFLSTAAHELRTPMASIVGFSELMLSHDYDEKIRRELLTTIHTQAGRLSDLLNDLLDLARIEARERKDWNIQTQPLLPIVQATVAGLLMPGDKRPLCICLPETLPWVAVDAAKLQQALTNVLSNAYKYSPAGGSIDLYVEERQGKEGREEIGLVVRDHGIGLTREQLQRVFERFYRADTSGAIPGTGLGLSLVKEIMELHDGSAELHSEPGEGTRASLWLPVQHNPQKQVAPA